MGTPFGGAGGATPGSRPDGTYSTYGGATPNARNFPDWGPPAAPLNPPGGPSTNGYSGGWE
jgi:hypothetical protein